MSTEPSTSVDALDNIIEEPSPIEKRLIEGRSFNDGDWSSTTLKFLYDAVMKYGSGAKPAKYFSNKLLPKSEDEIKLKFHELREISNEHREECQIFYRNLWTQRGYNSLREETLRKYGPLPWYSAIQEVNKDNHLSFTRFITPTRVNIDKNMAKYGRNAKSTCRAHVTDSKFARVSSKVKQKVSWIKIYRYMRKCIQLREDLPKLNELEAAIVLNTMYSIESEADMISDQEKSILWGLLSDIHMRDFRNFEPETPCNLESSVQAAVDPLRTRLHNIPVAGAEPEIVENDTNDEIDDEDDSDDSADSDSDIDIDID